MPRPSRILAAAALTAFMAAPVTAQGQEALQTTTISAIERGEAEAMVYLEGAALYQSDEHEYLFSDGTGVMVIVIDADADEAQGELPLFELMGIEGTVVGEEIDVSRWAPLRIATPAVIVPEEQVIEAYWGWIVAYGSQAPSSSPD
jgi:uncharacterized protein YdeI (BOF family)